MSTVFDPTSNKVKDFGKDHDGIELFVIEEAFAIPPVYLALMDKMMTAAFNPKHIRDSSHRLPPFEGRRMLFLGDQAQLPPIGGPAVYGDRSKATEHMQISKKKESNVSKRSSAGQAISENYLLPNCIYLERSQRNTGLLGQICDRMRRGELTENDLTMLTYQRARFPDLVTDYGIHYTNDMCSMYNWRQLANEYLLSAPRSRIFLAKAIYHVTTTNQDVVNALSVLPPQAYDYAPDILCIAEGSEVRLLQNMNIAAGLVTSQSGTVIKVIYNNADVEALVSGEHVKHVVPYCIIVSFSGFQGFLQKKTSGRTTTRVFSFWHQKSWVPIYRKRFNVKVSSLPPWVRKRQMKKSVTEFSFLWTSQATSLPIAHKVRRRLIVLCPSTSASRTLTQDWHWR